MKKPSDYLRSVLQGFHRQRRKRQCSRELNSVSDHTSESLIDEEMRIYLDTCSWYWGNLSDEQADFLLRDTEEGTYIARHSIDETCMYCITYKLDGIVASVRVYESDGQLSINFDDPSQVRAPTLHGLIAKLVQLSANIGFACKVERSPKILPLKLSRPVNRLSSLRAHCKRVIRMSTSDETIKALGLPKHIVYFLLWPALR